MSEHRTEAGVVADIARQATEPMELDAGGIYSVVDVDGKTRIVDLELYADAPRRTASTPAFVDATSFADYVNRYKKPETSLFADVVHSRIDAVIDEIPLDGAPAWRGWSPSFQARWDESYVAWRRVAGNAMSQVAFAEFMEENAHLVTNYDAADLIEIAQTFHATQTGSFRSIQRLRNGDTQLKYTQETTASAGQAGEMAVPSDLHLRTPIYFGGPAEDILVRLRYRAREGSLAISLVIDKQAEREQLAFRTIADGVAMATEKAVWYGTPGA